MSESEDRFDAPPDPVIEELRDELFSLRTLLSVSLICLIVLALSVDRFMFKQVTILRTNIHNTEVAADQLRAEFPYAKASEVWSALVVYSKTHPDYLKVLNNFTPYVNQTVLVTNR